MAHLVMARKWRPRQFADLVGQDLIVNALQRAIADNSVHHAYLFTGTRGVGKTSIARILAMALNCEQGVTNEPCGECGACKAVIEGHFPDLIEVDAASKTKVEDTKTLLEQVPYLPTMGRYKVYLIDEVHMFSNHSFNALLKTLEEPPAHVVFILATTDPEKLPKTIQSRCLHFPLQPLSEQVLASALARLLAQDDIAVEQDALPVLAKAANGSFRDALSLLEPMIGTLTDGPLTAEHVTKMLGWCPGDLPIELVTAVLKKDVPQLVETARQALAQGFQAGQLINQVLEGLHTLSLLHTGVSLSDASLEGWSALLPQCDLAQSQLLYQLLLMAKRDLPYAVTPQQGLEMALLRLVAFLPAEISAGAQAPVPVQAQQAPVVEKPRAVPVQSRPAINIQEKMNMPVAEQSSVPDVAPAVVAPVVEANAPAPTPPTAGADLSQLTVAQWPDLLAKLPLSGMNKLLAENCILERVEGQLMHLALDNEKQIFYQKNRIEAMAEVMSTYFGQPMRVNIEVKTVDAPTPMSLRLEKEASEQSAAQASLTEDPSVQALLTDLEGELHGVKPLPQE